MPWKNGNPPLYATWRTMLDRCYRSNRKEFKDYGARGIKVCPQWRDNFKRFVADMGPKPTPKHTLDRIDNDGNYTPQNCCWSTRKDQQRNQTVTRRVIIEGVEYVAADLADVANIKTDTIVERAQRGLCYKDVISKTRFRNISGLALGAEISAKKRRIRQTCKHGHEYTPENTMTGSDGKYSWRVCRVCYEVHRHSNSQLKE